MKMICDAPNEVIKSVRMGTWFGSSVLEKMIANGIPLEQIRAEIEQEIIPRNSDQYDHEAMWQNVGLRMALKVIGKYQAETEEI